MESLLCPLCSGESKSFYIHGQREFLQCSLCLSVFLNPKDYLSTAEEQAHYLCHNNDPDDEGYRKFLSPVTEKLLLNFTKEDKGLDFGSGTGSPIVKVLEENGYNISQYDLFFHNYPERLQQQYNYVSSSETIEHFKEPYKEFELLKSLLLPKGKLFLMTDLFDENRDFGTWYYKTDPTHVFLYHPKAFEWIKDNFGYSKVTIDKRVITLEL